MFSQCVDNKAKKKWNQKEQFVFGNRIRIERIRSLTRYHLLLIPPTYKRISIHAGKTSLRTSLKKASIAVETALVLPIFFLGMVTMISFMDIYKLQTEHLTKLCEKTKEAGMYAYVLDGSGPDNITLPDFYTYEPIGGLVPLPDVRMFNTVKVHAWTGKEYANEEGQAGSEEKEKEPMVYVTENGSVYHKDIGCSYLDLSISHVSKNAAEGLRNHYGEKYSPCETCGKGQEQGGMVYITETGNRYHTLESCSGLKRTVRMEKQSHVSGKMHACSRCG
ncbi:MAG TPA: hypothetical protein IAA06_09770 [Candidatus Blautia faecavium]|uniref:Pilus assembly protein n=1 Tax=Candidatus Blautia faecavium TaxID=2838487 RepID=A0A9D2LTD2_9FIRM|nr:hypothetical protein [Candidatus Blautia faecavium]